MKTRAEQPNFLTSRLAILRWHLQNYYENFSWTIGALLASTAMDAPFPIRANLILVATVFLTHVVPTLFLAFTNFDKLKEWLARWVYTHAGPIGLGVVIHAFLQNLYLSHDAPEGVTLSTGVLIALTTGVLFAYWASGVMSRDVRFFQFVNSGYEWAVKWMIIVLKNNGYHIHADEGITTLLAGRVSELLESEWWSKTESYFATEKLHMGILYGAERALRGVVEKLEAEVALAEKGTYSPVSVPSALARAC